MRLVSVDFQNDFMAPGGVHFQGQPCVEFVTGTVVPYAREHGIAVAEVISDYRGPADEPGDGACVPGKWGYESAIPADLKPVTPWVKASIAPTWARDGGGRADVVPGQPRPDPAGFAAWLGEALGPPDRGGPVVVMGLVLEVCVLATLIELRLRDYPAAVLLEGVDTYDGDRQRKLDFLGTLSGFWGEPVTWAQCTAALGSG